MRKKIIAANENAASIAGANGRTIPTSVLLRKIDVREPGKTEDAPVLRVAYNVLDEEPAAAVKKKSVWREAMDGFHPLLRVTTYFTTANLLKDLKTIKEEVLKISTISRAGIFLANVFVTELVSMPISALLGFTQGAEYGPVGTALGATFGGLLPSLLIMQLGWLGTFFLLREACKAEGGEKQPFRINVEEREILKMMIRGTFVSIVVGLPTLAAVYGLAAKVGDTVAVTFGLLKGALEFIAGASMLIVNKDVIDGPLLSFIKDSKVKDRAHHGSETASNAELEEAYAYKN